MLQIIHSMVSSYYTFIHFYIYITKGRRMGELTFAKFKTILPSGEQSDGGFFFQKISQEKQFTGTLQETTCVK